MSALVGHCHSLSTKGSNSFLSSLQVNLDGDGDLNTTQVVPIWPAKPFKLACPSGTPAGVCNNLYPTQSVMVGCFEPERESQEEVNSFLVDCPGCLYVDVGCNVGYLTVQSATLGANVECYEPNPHYASAIKKSVELNGVQDRVNVHTAAVVPDDASDGTTLKFDHTYTPCGIGEKWDGKPFDVKAVSIRRVVQDRKVKLLKIDIDSVEGAILHTLIDMIKNSETEIETMTIELGEGPNAWCAETKDGCEPGSEHPRGGDIKDLRTLQHDLGYDLYRLNVHTDQEILDWRGQNVNKNMAPQTKGLTPMYNVRNMRKLEKYDGNMDVDDYRMTMKWAVTIMATKVQLAEVTTHHYRDLAWAKIGDDSEEAKRQMMLNKGNPALQKYPMDNKMKMDLQKQLGSKQWNKWMFGNPSGHGTGGH